VIFFLKILNNQNHRKNQIRPKIRKHKANKSGKRNLRRKKLNDKKDKFSIYIP
jgi:hypothetical protein